MTTISELERKRAERRVKHEEAERRYTYQCPKCGSQYGTPYAKKFGVCERDYFALNLM